MLRQPNFGRKSYWELIEYLEIEGLVPIYVDEGSDSDDSMTGGLMR